jgi:hypothetical protein
MGECMKKHRKGEGLIDNCDYRHEKSGQLNSGHIVAKPVATKCDRFRSFDMGR